MDTTGAIARTKFTRFLSSTPRPCARVPKHLCGRLVQSYQGSYTGGGGFVSRISPESRGGRRLLDESACLSVAPAACVSVPRTAGEQEVKWTVSSSRWGPRPEAGASPWDLEETQDLQLHPDPSQGLRFNKVPGSTAKSFVQYLLRVFSGKTPLCR